MRELIAVSLAVLAAGCDCDHATTTPDTPATSSVVVGALTPSAGSTVVVPAAFPYIIPGGVVLPPRSNLVSVGLTLTSAHEVAQWAQLRVYLLTGESNTEYCGLNDPDSPTWARLPAGWTTSYTVTGFRVYRLPCEVTGLRIMLHTRNSGQFAPPSPSETIAEAIVPLRFRLVREE
jgi:hypothetical protein